MEQTAILLISCRDQKGITATVTDFIFRHNGNIVHADQHIDEQSNTFFMRIEWSLADFDLKNDQIQESFDEIVQKYDMDWELSFSEITPNVAIFVSKHLHCLQDILLRKQEGQLNCQIPVIISNHPDAKYMAKTHNIEYFEIPKNAKNKEQAEKREVEILRNKNIDLVVLARYHQILTPYFIDNFSNRIINIHHSFLPAFPGKKPYNQAYEKGVKIIGATSHYVTEKLDDGPIIEQDTTRISHRDSIQDLIDRGEDLEKQVLFRALKYHLARKILIFNNKTVIFD